VSPEQHRHQHPCSRPNTSGCWSNADVCLLTPSLLEFSNASFGYRPTYWFTLRRFSLSTWFSTNEINDDCRPPIIVSCSVRPDREGIFYLQSVFWELHMLTVEYR
jgi:hypothetical protein